MKTIQNFETATHKALEQVMRAGYAPNKPKPGPVEPAGCGLGLTDAYYVHIEMGVCEVKIPCESYESARLVAAVLNRHTKLKVRK